MSKIESLYNAVLKGKRKIVKKEVQLAVEDNVEVNSILMDSMIPAMREIGARFSNGDAFVPEMLVSARAMQAGLDILKPLLDKAGHEPLGRIAIGTVKGDLHDIGKNLVMMMVKGAGYEIIDLGVDIDVETYEKCVVENDIQVLMLSALLTTTIPYMKNVVDHFKAKNIDCKIMIGGAPVTQRFCDDIGADAYCEDANIAVEVLEKVIAS